MFEGEVRQVGIEVISRTAQDFVIDAAEYKIIDINGNEVESGLPAINGHKVTTLFNADVKGVYDVIFKYHIAAEILKAKVSVEVR